MKTVMKTPTENVTPSRSVIMKLLARPFDYRHPQATGAVRLVVGIWWLILGALLISGGFWWGASLWVAAALFFWVGYHLQPSAQS